MLIVLILVALVVVGLVAYGLRTRGLLEDSTAIKNPPKPKAVRFDPDDPKRADKMPCEAP